MDRCVCPWKVQLWHSCCGTSTVLTSFLKLFLRNLSITLLDVPLNRISLSISPLHLTIPCLGVLLTSPRGRLLAALGTGQASVQKSRQEAQECLCRDPGTGGVTPSENVAPQGGASLITCSLEGSWDPTKVSERQQKQTEDMVRERSQRTLVAFLCRCVISLSRVGGGGENLRLNAGW